MKPGHFYYMEEKNILIANSLNLTYYLKSYAELNILPKQVPIVYSHLFRSSNKVNEENPVYIKPE